MKKQFNGKELAEALRNKTFENVVELVGPVKEGADPNSILFRLQGECQTWVDIPVDCIADADHLGEELGPDGSFYPVFRLYLGVPSDNPAAAAFAKLLKRTAR